MDDDDWGDDDFGNNGFDSDGDGGFGSDDDIVRNEEYKVLEEKELRSLLNELVVDTAELLGIDNDMASLMLRSFGWSSEKFESRYYENRDKLLKDVGLNFLLDERKGGPVSANSMACEKECRICDEVYPTSEGFALGCGHWFCVTDWRKYLLDRVSRGKQCILSTCPEYKCQALVSDSIFASMLSATSPTKLAKYKYFLLRSFVEDNRRIKWCPAPRCERAIYGDTALRTVACKCNYKFCFKCNEEAHLPASCEDLQEWLDKCRNESETAHWIIANTKKCPKCFVRIEKNQGCNHMTCRSCKHEFCWVCDGSWSEHGNTTGGYYKCNKFDPKAAKSKAKAAGADAARSEAKAELDRYLHYYQRYHNHDQSKKYADKQRTTQDNRMTTLQAQSSNSSTWMDVQFLKKATEQVFECRRVLSYTYVFAYYLKDGPEKDLFEFLQQQLETSTEFLSELSEMPLERLNRTEVVNYTRVTNNFLLNLLEGVDNGLTSF